MTRTKPHAALRDLFSGPQQSRNRETLAEGAVVLRGFATAAAPSLLQAIHLVVKHAPFRHMVTRGGHRMSVAMTNCGELGWTSDERGYRYTAHDPLTGQRWPSMPTEFTQIATRAAYEAGFAAFDPDACIVNGYEPGARLTLHQDRDEHDFAQPIVSISLGLPAVFLFGGLERKARYRRVLLEHADVVVWGGTSRLVYHGIDRLDPGRHPLTGEFRFNLTFRKAGERLES